MDPPKHVRNLLEIFPSEIWACIAMHLTGEQLYRLKLTGTNNLWRKLKSTNVVKSFILGTDHLQFASWPAFLNEFPSVSELCLCSDSIQKWLGWSPRLSSLPNTLKKLKICGWVDWTTFFHSPEGIQLNFENQVPHLEVLDLELSIYADSIWLAQVPTTLTELRVARWHGDLPPTLIHFEARTELVLKSSNTKLPPRLEVMEGHAIRGSLFLLPMLPPTLRKLRFGRWEQLENTFLRPLPTSLETLGRVSFRSVSPEIISLLPPSLTDLSLANSVPPDCWSPLPGTLKKLHFNLVPNCDSSLTERQIERTYPLHLLPRSITELNFTEETYYTILRGFIELPAPSSTFPIGSQFPPYLTTFTAPECQLTPNATKHLPASLKSLTMFWLCERVCEHLPRGLTSLNATRALMSPAMLNFLPPQLLSLELGYAPDSQKIIDFSNLKGTIVTVSSLPGFSAHQEYKTNWLGDQSSLPPSLTRIILNYFRHVGDSFAGQYLPNAIELELRYTQDFTDLAIPLLGRHLKILILNNSNKITGQCFASLPRTLEDLEIDSSSSIYDSDIQHLPRDLRRIAIRSAVHLTDECVQSFPRHAVFIQIERNNLLTTVSFPNLPYPIKNPVYGSNAHFAAKIWQVRSGKIMIQESESIS